MEKYYLCFCNHCNNAFIDSNPSKHSISYIASNPATFDGLMTLERIEDTDENGKEIFIGCPVCKDDAFLMDNLPAEIADTLGIQKVN